MAHGLREPGSFYGTTRKYYSDGNMQISESTYAGGELLPPHAHELAFFCLCLDGAYDESYIYRRNSFEPFSLIYHPPGEQHSCDMRYGDVRVFNIELSHSLLESLSQISVQPGVAVDHGDGQLVWLATRVLTAFRRGSKTSAMDVEHLVHEMLAVTARMADRIERTPPNWFRRALECLNDSFADPPSLAHLAREVAIHPVHLSRVFRTFTGRTLGEYIRMLRLRHAADQLVNSRAALAEVALNAGFADQSHMTRTFTEVTGLPPARFRRLHA